MKLRQAVSLAGGAIIALTILISAESIYADRTMRQEADRALGAVAASLGSSQRITAAAYDVKIDVIQVQQWLTDVSATRGRDGLDDGFETAESFAGRLGEDLQRARALAAELRNEPLTAALDQIEQGFGPYYAAGRRMAEAYVAGGPEAGNAMMAEFDAAAEKLGAAVDAMVGEIDAIADRAVAAAAASRVDIDRTESLGAWLDIGGNLLLIAGVVALVAFMARQFAHLTEVSDTAREIADWNLDAPRLGASRWAEMSALHKAIGFFRDRLGELKEQQAETARLLEKAADSEGQVAAIGKSQAVIEFTPEGEVLRANDNFLAAAGYAAEEEIVGKHHSIFMDPEEARSEAYRQFWRDLKEGRFQAREFRRRTKSGGDFWIQASYNPILSQQGVVVKVVKYATDVTARKEAVDAIAESLRHLAEGDLSTRISAAVDGDFAELRDAFNGTLERLQAMVREIQASSRSMVGATQSISSGANELSERAESQASSLEETAATMEEMTASIKANADNAAEAEKAAASAAERAGHGGDIVGQAVTAMTRIEESAEKISDITTVIESIAFQTNLLALNAAVEAARAGDAGKGFAIVASEVRNLAQRSSDAAKDITQLIQTSGGHVEHGAKLVRQTGEALAQIDEAIISVSHNMDGISSASREQASGVEEISNAVSHMDGMTQQNSALAEQSAAAAKALAGQAERLSQLVSFFRADGGEPVQDDAWRDAAAEAAAPAEPRLQIVPPPRVPASAAPAAAAQAPAFVDF